MNTPKMRRALKMAAYRVRGKRPPSEGMMSSVLYGDIFKDGDHWQVEFIYDLRMHPRPYLSASHWPKDKRNSGYAPHHLCSDKSGNVIRWNER